MLILARKTGEALLVGDGVEIKVVEVSGDKVKLGISAPSDVKVIRKELVQTIEQNHQAAQMGVGLPAIRNLLGKLSE